MRDDELVFVLYKKKGRSLQELYFNLFNKHTTKTKKGDRVRPFVTADGGHELLLFIT